MDCVHVIKKRNKTGECSRTINVKKFVIVVKTIKNLIVKSKNHLRYLQKHYTSMKLQPTIIY